MTVTATIKNAAQVDVPKTVTVASSLQPYTQHPFTLSWSAAELGEGFTFDPSTQQLTVTLHDLTHTVTDNWLGTINVDSTAPPPSCPLITPLRVKSSFLPVAATSSFSPTIKTPAMTTLPTPLMSWRLFPSKSVLSAMPPTMSPLGM
jgi:hypothetical protein